MFGRNKGQQAGQGGQGRPDDMAGLDPELAELMRIEEAERTGLAPAVAPGGRLDQLQLLSELHDQGVLSDAEFEAEKGRILNGF